jgi:hypothetical protein
MASRQGAHRGLARAADQPAGAALARVAGPAARTVLGVRAGRAVAGRTEIAQQLAEPPGEVVRVRGPAQRVRGDPVGARGAADTEVDPAGVHRFQGAELLRDDQRAVVGQHHATGADPQPRGRAGDQPDQYRGRAARDVLDAVVLGDPEPVVPQRVDVAGQFDGLTERRRRRGAGEDGRDVEDGQAGGGAGVHGGRSSTGAEQGRYRRGAAPDGYDTGIVPGIAIGAFDWSFLGIDAGVSGVVR